MVVIDASAVVDVITEQSPSQALTALLQRERIHAPELIDYEVASALRGLSLAARLDDEALLEAVQDWQRFKLERHSLSESLPAMLELRQNFTAYDASYIILAKALRAPLVTADTKLMDARRLGIEVQLFA